MKIGRRGLFKTVAVTGGATMLHATTGQAQEVCNGLLTPVQPEGPFYPEQAVSLWEPDSDLTTIAGSNKIAAGEKIVLAGTITDENCLPLEGAELHIWQADHQGVYQHSRDPRAQMITPDPNFQYWAKKITTDNGQFSFLTIKPGAYPAGGTWIRPAHIHLKVVIDGFVPIISQIYFAPDSTDVYDVSVLAVTPGLVDYYKANGGKAVTQVLHRLDGILGQVPNIQKPAVILAAEEIAAPASLKAFEPSVSTVKSYKLNIRLKSI